MKILLIDYDAGTAQLGGDTHTFDLAKQWTAAGAQVVIAAADHSYLRRRNPEVPAYGQLSKQEGVEMLWIRTPAAADREKKILHGAWPFEQGLYKSLPLIRQFGPDAVVLSSRHLLGAVSGMRLARKLSIPLITEVRRVYPEHLTQQLEYEPNHYLVRLFGWLQRRLYRKSQRILSVYTNLQEHIKELGGDAARFSPLPRGLSPSFFAKENPAQRHLDFIRRYKAKGNFILLAAGQAEKEQHLDLLIAAAKTAPHHMMFLIVGNGMYKPNLKRTVREHNLTNVLFLDGVAPGQLQGLFQAADGAYVGIMPHPWHRYGADTEGLLLPMGAGVPVICAADLPDNPVETAACGFVVGTGDQEGLSRSLRVLASMPEESRRKMGQLGKTYAREHGSFSNQADRFLQIIEETVNEYKEKEQTSR